MRTLTLLTLLLAGAAIALILWQLPQNLDEAVRFAQAYPLLSAALLILWRIVAIVIPPLPGGTVAFALIPVFGWWQTYLYSFIAILAGTSAAFHIARRFREPLAARFVPLRRIHEWEAALSPRKEFFGFMGLRFLTSPAMDFLSYAAGLTRLRFRTFFWVMVVSELPFAVLYYGSGELYEWLSQRSTFLGILALVSIGGIISLAGAYWSRRSRKKI